MRLTIPVFSVLCLAISLDHSISADDDPTAERALRRAEMRRRAESLQLELSGQKTDRQPKLLKDPLLRFDDPTRSFYDGALWAWGNRGRPQVIVSIEKYEKVWAYELVSLTAEPFALKTESDWTWSPTDPPFVEQPLAAAAVGETAALRKKQARELSRRFEAAEFVGENETRTVLRLVPRPIFEYGDPEAALLSGAMFIFANGTNPEVLLLLEAQSDGGDKPQWQFAFVPLSTAPLEALLAGKTVWTATAQRKPQAQRPYTYFAVPSRDIAAE